MNVDWANHKGWKVETCLVTTGDADPDADQGYLVNSELSDLIAAGQNRTRAMILQPPTAT